MAMTIDRKKALLAGLVSAAFLGVVLWTANAADISLSVIDPVLVVALVCVYALQTIMRGMLLRSLAAALNPAALVLWIRLAARHQLLFTLTPSGAGDIGFPYLLRVVTGLPATQGLPILARYRLRDVLMLGALGAAGILAYGSQTALAVATLCISLPALWFVDDLTELAFRFAYRLSPSGRISALLAAGLPDHPTPVAIRNVSTLFSAAIWLLAACGTYLAFVAAGHAISPAAALIVLVMINAIGAIAISIAGLGVSEAGVAGALLLLGMPASEAAATALVARPLLLICMLAAAGLVEAATLPLRARRARETDPVSRKTQQTRQI